MAAKLLELCLTRSSQPSKQDFARIMFPVKQLLGLAIGLTCGILGLTGLFTILL